MKTSLFSHSLSKVLDWTFPLHCSFCGDYDILSRKISICRSCYPRSIVPDVQLCEICKSPWVEEAKSCSYCGSRNIFFDRLDYGRIRGERETRILDRVKFREEFYLRFFFRMGLGKKISILKYWRISKISFVPSNSSTLRKRPYLVAEPAMKWISKALNQPILPLLEKQSGELQSGKTFTERFFHARFAFRIRKEFEKKLSGNVLLVDDVFTTGATLNECARILKENGAEKVYLFTLLKGLNR